MSILIHSWRASLLHLSGEGHRKAIQGLCRGPNFGFVCPGTVVPICLHQSLFTDWFLQPPWPGSSGVIAHRGLYHSLSITRVMAFPGIAFPWLFLTRGSTCSPYFYICVSFRGAAHLAWPCQMPELCCRWVKGKSFWMQPCTVAPAALHTALLPACGKRKQKVKITFTVVISGKKSGRLYRKSPLQILFTFTSKRGFPGTCPSCLPFPSHVFLLSRYHRVPQQSLTETSVH